MESFPKGPLGLTTDAAKATPEWKAAKAESDAAVAAERAANSAVVKARKESSSVPVAIDGEAKPRVRVKDGKPYYAENDPQTLSAYFQPGRIVPSYGGGRDRVIAFTPGTDTESWSVKVQAIGEDGNPKIENGASARERSHKTLPTKRELISQFGQPQKVANTKKAKPANPVAAAAAQAATSPTNQLAAPTEAQREAGNFTVGRISIGGLEISIEYPAGVARREGQKPLANAYGYIRGTVARDGDHLDVFLGPKATDTSLPIFVIDQNTAEGKFDESKVVMGVDSAEAATALYNANYPKGWDRAQGVRKFTPAAFKLWAMNPANLKKPATKRPPVGVIRNNAAKSLPEPGRSRDPRTHVVGPNDLQRHVSRIVSSWRGDIPTVRTVEHARQLPLQARRDNGWEKAEGWYDGRGTIYLVARNLPNLTRAEQVLAHEAFGHYGVEGVVGKNEWTRIVGDVAKLRRDRAKLSPEMQAALASVERRYGSENAVTFARETLAVMAERGIRSSVLGRVLAAVRRWLRALNINTSKWNENELREIVAKGARQVRERGQRRVDSGRGAAFSLADTSPDSVVSAVASSGKAPGNEFIERVKGKVEDWRPQLLGVLTLRQLAEISKPYTPGGDRYMDLVTAMQTRRNVLQGESADLAQRWEKMQRADRKKSTAAEKAARNTASDHTVDLMHDATVAGTDPAEAYQVGSITLLSNGDTVTMEQGAVDAAISKIDATLDAIKTRDETPDSLAEKRKLIADKARLNEGMAQEKERAKAYPLLKARFDRLPSEWKDLYRDVRDAYAKRADQMMEALLNRIENLEIAAREKAALKERVRANFESARVQAPYFPLARFGEFWASVERTNSDGEEERQFLMAETQRERDAIVRKAEAQGWKLAKKGRKIENVRAQDGASGAFVSDVIGTLSDNNVSEAVQDEIYQLYLRTLPDLSTRKQFIHRKKIAGYDADALRAFASQGNHSSHQLARLEYGQQLQDALTAIVNQAKEAQNTASEDADKASAAAGEFKRRNEWVMNPTSAKWVQALSSLNFVFYLGISPASALTNMTQTAIITYPALAARYGWMKALNQTSSAMIDSIRSKGHIDRTLTNPDEKRAWQQLVDMGAIDVTQSHDLAGIGDNPTTDYNPKLAKAMNIVSSLFHKAEVFNREATGLAAYRMAREAGDSHEAAVKRAADTIWQTHYDYTNANRARIMQGNAAKVLFAFKQYAQNTTYYLWRAFYEATKGETPEVRKIARNRLLGTLGMTAVFSGGLGLPMVKMMFGIANAMAAAFGDDDDPFDAETEFRNFLADLMPPDAARFITDGAVEGLPSALGLPAPDISGRTSMSDLWFRSPDREMEGKDMWHYILEQISGPIGAMFGGMISGSSLIGEGMATGNSGQIWRGVESMIPKAAKDVMKAIRYGTQGVNTMRGDPLIEDASPSDWIYQGLGFTPARVADQYAINSAAKGYEKAVMDRRQVLMDGYALASKNKDTEAARALLAKIRDFNKKHPGIGISANSLRKSLQSREKFSARAVGGIVVSPKLQGEVDKAVRWQ